MLAFLLLVVFVLFCFVLFAAEPALFPLFFSPKESPSRSQEESPPGRGKPSCLTAVKMNDSRSAYTPRKDRLYFDVIGLLIAPWGGRRLGTVNKVLGGVGGEWGPLQARPPPGIPIL